MIIKIIIWTFILSFLVAKLELEIEGKKGGGWARNLPTKRYSHTIITFFIHKEITGYHIFLLLTLFTVFHGMFIFMPWTIKNESIILGLFSIFFVLEDFLWFVCNTHYGIKNFRKGKISWHRRWIWRIPVSYIIGIITGITLLCISYF